MQQPLVYPATAVHSASFTQVAGKVAGTTGTTGATGTT